MQTHLVYTPNCNIISHNNFFLYRVAWSRLTHFKWSQIIYGKREKFAKPSINTSKYAIYYRQITSLFSENYRLMASVYISALLQACLEVAVHAPQYVLINSRNFVNNGLFEFLNSHDMPLEHNGLTGTPSGKSLVQ